MNENCTSASDVTDVLVGGTYRQESHQLRSFLCMVGTETNAPNHPRCPSTTKPETDSEGPVSRYECVPHRTHERSQPSSAGVLGPRLQVEITPSIPRSFSRSALARSPSQGQVDRPFNTTTPHSPSMASSLSVSGPLNVLIFGETGVGKSSVINLILGEDLAQTSADAQTCTLEHTAYAISLENRQFKLWEVSSIASTNFFRRLFMKWNMKRKYKKLFKAEGVYLLLYCMRNSRAQGILVKDYNYFTSIVGSSAGCGPNIAAVVTFLEDYPGDMDDWWKKNEQNLAENGMRFSNHACITSLPDEHLSAALSARRWRSELIIRQLICDSYQAGTSQITVNSVPIRRSFLNADATRRPAQKPKNVRTIPTNFFAESSSHPDPDIAPPITPPVVLESASPIPLPAVPEDTLPEPQLNSPERSPFRLFKWLRLNAPARPTILQRAKMPFFKQRRRQDEEGVELKERPPAIVDVPLSPGLPADIVPPVLLPVVAEGACPIPLLAMLEDAPPEVQPSSPERAQPPILRWGRPFFFRRSQRHDNEAVELQERPSSIVDVPLAHTLPRNYNAREVRMKRKKEKEKARQAKIAEKSRKNVQGATRSQSPTRNNIIQQSSGQSQGQPSSESHPAAFIPSAVAATSNPTPVPATVSVTPAPATATLEAGCWTLFLHRIGCVSAPHAGGHH